MWTLPPSPLVSVGGDILPLFWGPPVSKGQNQEVGTRGSALPNAGYLSTWWAEVNSLPYDPQGNHQFV